MTESIKETSNGGDVSGSEWDAVLKALYDKLLNEAADGGYNLNPDLEFVMDLVEGLQTNLNRYGYLACPCRLAEGIRQADLDIICPCDYRDDDLAEYGACYCALYVSDEIASGLKQASSIPERRPAPGPESGPTPAPEGRAPGSESGLVSAPEGRAESGSESGPAPGGQPVADIKGLAYPVYRCRVCGYLCANNQPPGKCPVCKADRDRFERFI